MLILSGECIVNTFLLSSGCLGKQLAHTLTIFKLRLDESRENGRVERLSDIGIGSHVETLDLILGSDLRRHEDDGDMAKLNILFDLLMW